MVDRMTRDALDILVSSVESGLRMSRGSNEIFVPLHMRPDLKKAELLLRGEMSGGRILRERDTSDERLCFLSAGKDRGDLATRLRELRRA